jgi:hypothetical protein
MNAGERPRTKPNTPPPQLESVLRATPHEFAGRPLEERLRSGKRVAAARASRHAALSG